jgi:hypothetical protein
MPAEPPLLREIYTNEGIEDPTERERHEKELSRWRAELENTDHPCRHYTAEWNNDATTPEILLPLSSPSSDPLNIARWRKQWARAGVEIMGKVSPLILRWRKKPRDSMSISPEGD